MVFALGEADAMRGRLDAARACCDRLGLAPSYMARDLVKKAFTASQIGQLGATEKLLLAAIALDSTETAPRRVLIRAYVMTGRLDDARAALIRARAAGFGGAALHIYQAMIAASGGDMHEATRALALVDESSLKTDKFLLEDLAYVRHLVASPRDTVH
jgi:hypothetical protein